MNPEQILETFGLSEDDLAGPAFDEYRRAREEADAALATLVERLQARADEIAAALEADLRQRGVFTENDHVTMTVTFDG